MKTNGLSQDVTRRRGPDYLRALFLLALLANTAAFALLGNIKVGSFKVPCAIACGGSTGVVNFNVMGDTFHSLFTKSSTDAFGDEARSAGNELIAKAKQELNAVLAKGVEDLRTLAVEQRTAFFQDLNKSSNDALDRLDQVMADRLEQLNGMLDQQMGQGSGALERIVVFLNAFLVFTAAAAAVISLLVVLGTRAMKQRRLDGRAIGIGLGVATTAFLIAFSFGQIALRVTRHGIENDIRSAYSEGDVLKVAYHTARLSSFAPSDAKVSARATAARILRDLAFRPTAFRRESTLEATIRLALVSQQTVVEKTGDRDPELDGALASMLWRSGDSRGSELLAARFAAAALLACAEKAKLPCMADRLARRVLTAYLLSPIPQAEQANYLAVPLQDGEQLSPALPKQYELTELIAAAGGPETERSSDLPMTLAQLHVHSLDLYSRLTLLHARALATDSSLDLAKIKNQRDAIAIELEQSWRTFTASTPDDARLELETLALNSFYVSQLRASEFRRLPGTLWFETIQDPLVIGTCQQRSAGLSAKAANAEYSSVSSALASSLRSRELTSAAAETLTASIRESEAKIARELTYFEMELSTSRLKIGTPYKGCRKALFGLLSRQYTATVTRAIRADSALQAANAAASLGLYVCADESIRQTSRPCPSDAGVVPTASLIVQGVPGVDPSAATKAVRANGDKRLSLRT